MQLKIEQDYVDETHAQNIVLEIYKISRYHDNIMIDRDYARKLKHAQKTNAKKMKALEKT